MLVLMGKYNESRHTLQQNFLNYVRQLQTEAPNIIYKYTSSNVMYCAVMYCNVMYCFELGKGFSARATFRCVPI